MQRKNHDEFDTLHWVVVIGAIALVIAGLIELNARRQANASIEAWGRALTITPEQQAKLDAQLEQMQRESEAEVRKVIGYPIPQQRPTRSRSEIDSRPLGANEYCVDHVRIRRDGSRWTNIGTCR